MISTCIFNLGKAGTTSDSPDGLDDEFFLGRLGSVKISARVNRSTIFVLLGPQAGSIQIQSPNSSTKGMARLVKDGCEEKNTY